MPEVDEIVYLGDTITSDGKNERNLKSRTSKGMKIVSDIMEILETLSLGHHYFQTALLLRNSLLVNGMLTGVDAWSNLTAAEVKELSKVDRMLLGKILGSPRSSPEESYFLELGIEDFSTIISKRRVMYFHDIITRCKKDMLFNFIMVQWFSNRKGEWATLVKDDLKKFKITADIDSLQRIKKSSFKTMIKEAARKSSFGEMKRR